MSKKTIYLDDAIDAVGSMLRRKFGIGGDLAEITLSGLPSAQPERIQNNAVHLCDSCQYTYVTCPSHGNDAVFGDGKGNDNICACNKYRPISAQPERQKGHWRLDFMHNTMTCSECGRTFDGGFDLENADNFCRHCGSDNRGEQDGKTT